MMCHRQAQIWRPAAGAAVPPPLLRAPRARAPPLPRRRAAPAAPRAGIRGVESHDGGVLLDTVSQDLLTWSLQAPDFAAEVVAGCGLPSDRSVRFTGQFFQPVPWSPTTKHGMPPEMEVYRDKERYVIIQVPPKLIMGAMIKNIPRICAVFEICSTEEAAAAAAAGGGGADGGGGGGGFGGFGGGFGGFGGGGGGGGGGSGGAGGGAAGA
ncbi:MAG: hypothetical protein J3K34DRAFT_388909 [Monoraphidium minutum]|nr:MAG: hypothetical protein J3K34DRAFT_388909 [Monoraphidium minutum]